MLNLLKSPITVYALIIIVSLIVAGVFSRLIESPRRVSVPKDQDTGEPESESG